MPTHDQRCRSCGRVFEAVVAWDAYETDCACGGKADRVYHGSSVIDDTVTGGARWFHNLGDQPVWIEKRSELKKIMAERGLVFADRNNYSKDDKSPYATRTRLRPGQRDPFLHPA